MNRTFKKTKTCFFCDDVRKRKWPRTGKLFTVCSDSLSSSIKHGRISREGAFDVRESRERRDKIVPIKFPPEKQKKQLKNLKFRILTWNFPLFWARLLVVRESRDRRDRISDKNSQKRFFCVWVWDFFQKWVRIPAWKCIFFGAERLNLGTGGVTSKLARQWPYKCMPQKKFWKGLFLRTRH